MATAADLLWRLNVDCDGEAAPFGAVADPWQREDVQAALPGLLRVMGLGAEGGCRRHYWQRPRGHSKTADAGLLVAWALACAVRPVQIVAAAGDEEQAGYVKSAIARVCRLNPALDARQRIDLGTGKAEPGLLDVQAGGVVNKRTGAALALLSSDTATSFGSIPDLVLVDEWSHWRAGLEPFWSSLFSSIGKRRDAVLLVLSNAGWRSTWQHRVLGKLQKDPAWRCSVLPGVVASWIGADTLAEQERLLLPSEFARLWANQWQEGTGDALPEDAIARAVRATGPMLGTEPGWVFHAGLDLAVTQDCAALAAVGRDVGSWRPAQPEQPRRPAVRLPNEWQAMIELGLFDQPDEPEPDEVFQAGSGRLRLASCDAWKPGPGRPVDLVAVEDAVWQAHERYNLASVHYDPHQCALMAQRLSRRGVPMVPVPFTGGSLDEMAAALLEAFRADELDLYADPALLADLGRLQVARRSYGFRLDAPRTAEGHADRATALTLAVLGARRARGRPSGRVERDLVCWAGGSLE